MLSSLKGYMIAAGAVLFLALLTGAYLKGRIDVHKIDDPLFAQEKQKGKDEQAAADKTNIANNFVTKEAYNELQNTLAGYGSTIDDLSARLRELTSAGKPIILSSTVAAPCKPADPGPVGKAEASTQRPAEPAPASASTSTLDTEVLRDDLTLALQNIEALQVIIEASGKVQR